MEVEADWKTPVEIKPAWFLVAYMGTEWGP